MGGAFDAKGNRIAPEPSQGDLFDSSIYNASAKIGFKLDADQRLQLTASHYNAAQDTDYASDPAVARLPAGTRSEEHTSELQSQSNLVCRLLLEKKKKKTRTKSARKRRTGA